MNKTKPYDFKEVRCPDCGKMICEATGAVLKRCPRCKIYFIYDTEEEQYLYISNIKSEPFKRSE